jgi:hypothetical protein
MRGRWADVPGDIGTNLMARRYPGQARGYVAWGFLRWEKLGGVRGGDRIGGSAYTDL